MGITQEKGLRGERAAAEWLLEHRFRLLHTNWRSGRYEIDIVAENAGTLHIVEVKSRRAGSLTTPEDAITPAKFAALQKAAAAYIAAFDIDLEVQFDVVAVEETDGNFVVRYIPDAMRPGW